MELYGHSLTHYNGKNELDRKLVILHLANAVELILKDLVLDAGESIYKGPKETITIHGCLSTLEAKGVKLPFLNKVELLIDERNALQHRFGSPNQLTAVFYMNIAQEFFKEVLKKHYGLDHDEVLPQFADEQALVSLKLREPSNDQELERLQDLAKIHPLGALLSAWTFFERKTDSFLDLAGLTFGPRRPFHMELSRGRLEKYGVSLPLELRARLDRMRLLRNTVAHGQAEPSREDVAETIKTIEAIEAHLSGLNVDEIRAASRADRESYETQIHELNLRRTTDSVFERVQKSLELGGGGPAE